MPIRIQRKRTKGFRMPENTIYVGRPTYFGNMFKVDKKVIHSKQRTNSEVVEDFKKWAYSEDGTVLREMAKKQLKGKNLACWCKLGQPCHADVLLEIANS